MSLRPRVDVPALDVELWDGSDALHLVWLGRRSIPGIAPLYMVLSGPTLSAKFCSIRDRTRLTLSTSLSISSSGPAEAAATDATFGP